MIKDKHDIPSPTRKRSINTAFIKVRRGILKLTIQQAADLTSCSYQHWILVENCKRNGSETFYKRMAATLKCEVYELFDTTENAVRQYLNMRLQDHIQSSIFPAHEPLFELLSNKDFLDIAKNLGYVRDRASFDITWEERLRLQGKDPEMLVQLIGQFLELKRKTIAGDVDTPPAITS